MESLKGLSLKTGHLLNLRSVNGLSVLVTVFALASLVYLQMAPTWTILAISLSLGGCAGYALTHA